MDEFENTLIADFISEHWAVFMEFCIARGMDITEAEALYKKLTEE
jgi:hypothetical protein